MCTLLDPPTSFLEPDSALSLSDNLSGWLHLLKERILFVNDRCQGKKIARTLKRISGQAYVTELIRATLLCTYAPLFVVDTGNTHRDIFLSPHKTIAATLSSHPSYNYPTQFTTATNMDFWSSTLTFAFAVIVYNNPPTFDLFNKPTVCPHCKKCSHQLSREKDEQRLRRDILIDQGWDMQAEQARAASRWQNEQNLDQEDVESSESEEKRPPINENGKRKREEAPQEKRGGKTADKGKKRAHRRASSEDARPKPRQTVAELFPSVRETPQMPQMPQMPRMPRMPDMPRMPELSRVRQSEREGLGFVRGRRVATVETEDEKMDSEGSSTFVVDLSD